MLLTIDIGNSMTDFGLFSETGLIKTFKIRSDTGRSRDEYHNALDSFMKKDGELFSHIDRIIISSVVPPLTRVWLSLIKRVFNVVPLVVGPGLKNGLKIRVDNPLEVGSDLIADSVGANKKYGSSLFVADLGTANKYILIDKDGAFAGLSIAPGIEISLSALVERTSSLPEIGGHAPKKVIGKNTMDCMNSGITYGPSFEIMGFADAFEKEVGYPLKRILTGGNSYFVKGLLPSFEYDEWLLFSGLEEIDRRNR